MVPVLFAPLLFAPLPVAPVLVAPEPAEPEPIPACATSRHAPKDDSAVAAEVRAAAFTETAGGSAGR